jgi:glycosyltransferase involved in cell wall biosynthesis
LAEGLTNGGCSVTIITSEDYELSDLRRNFEVWFLFKRSRLKSWLSTVGTLLAKSQNSSEPKRSQTGTAQTVPSETWTLRQLRSAKFSLQLAKAAVLLFLNGTEIVHFQWIVDRRADLLFMRLLRLFGLKVVYTVHDVLPHDEDTPDNRAFYAQVYRYPDKLILHSENNRHQLLELFDIDNDRVSIIPHACRSLFRDHFGDADGTLRRELGIAADARVILFFGLIKAYKGVEFLLQAFDIISTQRGNVTLLIAGRVANHDAGTHRHYLDLLAGYSTNPHVRLRNEYIPSAEVAKYFSAADIVVLPYTGASQSGVLLSAYAAGKPVVATDTGGLGEVVKDGVTGYLVPPRDASALAHACLRLLDDAAARQKCGVEARRLAETTYSLASISRLTMAMYRNVVAAAPMNRVPERRPILSTAELTPSTLNGESQRNHPDA